MANSNPEIKQNIKVNHALQEPPMFKIIYMNDNVTTVEFVVSSITHDIHENGSAVVAVLPYEIAEQKGIEVTLEARAQGYPLQVKVEAEK